MNIRIKNRIVFFACVTMCLLLVSCTKDKDKIVDELMNQHIPSSLCGTWYQTHYYDGSHFDKIEISSDGTIDMVWNQSDGVFIEKARCLYDKKLIFGYYENGQGRWTRLYGSEYLIVEWTSSSLLWVGFHNGYLFSRTQGETPSYVNAEKDSRLLGSWFGTNNTVNLSLNQNGTGSFYSSSISEWWTKDGYLYMRTGTYGNDCLKYEVVDNRLDLYCFEDDEYLENGGYCDPTYTMFK